MKLARVTGRNFIYDFVCFIVVFCYLCSLFLFESIKLLLEGGKGTLFLSRLACVDCSCYFYW